MIYIFNYIFAVLGIFFLKNKKQLLVLFLFLLIFGGLRWKVGYDFENYFLDYELLRSGFNTGREYLIKKIAQISPTYSIYLLIILLFSLYFKMKAINKYSSMLGLSFYIYYTTSFIYDEMGRIRIGLATAIAYYYFFKIEEKQNKIYILIVIFLGITIHSSIFFMLILPFFYKLKLNRKVLASILLISILIGFLFTPKTIAYIMIYIKKMSIPGVSNSNLTNLYEAIPRKISMRDLFLLIVGSKIIYDYTDIKNKEKYFKVIALNYYLGILIFFLFRNILILSTRGSEVMLASEFLLIPYLIKNLKKIEKLLAIILIVLYYGYLYFKIVLNQPYYPYNFI